MNLHYFILLAYEIATLYDESETQDEFEDGLEALYAEYIGEPE